MSSRQSVLSLMVAAFSLAAFASFPDTADAQNGCIGFANYNDFGVSGTIGGGNGTIVHVKTRAELARYAGMGGSYIIYIDSTLTGGGIKDTQDYVSITSNKTIIGSGSGALLNGLGFDVKGQNNIIIRNLTITKGKPDAIAFRNSHHIWIDHCDLSASDDGLLDFTIGSSYMTVSWCRLHNHDKVSICNSGTQHFEDYGRQRVTYHHNWFYSNVQRNPRVGYGLGHVFNNRYDDITSYCVGYHTGAKVLVENNYFNSSKNPFCQMYSADPMTASYANAQEVGNVFVNTSGSKSGTGKSFLPTDYYDYSFALENANTAGDDVKAHAGPVAGIEYDIVGLPGNGSIDVLPSNCFTWSKMDRMSKYELQYGTDTTAMQTVSVETCSYTPDALLPSTMYYWRVKAIGADTAYSSPLWCFRTASVKAAKPYPADNDKSAELRQATSETSACTPLKLKWQMAMNALKYQVYLGTTADLSASDFLGETSSASMATNGLKLGKDYYWRVDAVGADGSVNTGDVWHFASKVAYAQEGKTEMEHTVCNGRAYLEVENGVYFKASNDTVVVGEAGPGCMTAVWNGDDADCDVSLTYFDENDGQGWYGIAVNDVRVDSWTASQNNEKLVTHTCSNVALHKGDEIRIDFYTNNKMMNRTDCMNVKVNSLLSGIRDVTNGKFGSGEQLVVNVYSPDGRYQKSFNVVADACGGVPSLNHADVSLTKGLYVYQVIGKAGGTFTTKMLVE